MFLLLSLMATTPNLMGAVNDGNIADVQSALDAGQNPNVSDNNKVSVLHFAALRGFIPIAQLLIDRGADVNRPDVIGSTPLLHAIFPNDHTVDMVKFLIKKGANINAMTTTKRTALISAVDFSNHPGFRRLEPETKLEIAQILLDHGANPNVQEHYKGDTALMIAIKHGDINLVKLLAPRSDLTLKNEAGRTALDLANSYAVSADIKEYLNTFRQSE